MIVSQNRLLKIVPPWQQVYLFPTSNPADDLDYSLDISACLEDISLPQVTQVTAAISPSGSGELSATNIEYQNSIITIWLSGGRYARMYTVNFVVYCQNDLHFSFFVQIPMDTSPISEVFTPAPSPYYGPIIST